MSTRPSNATQHASPSRDAATSEPATMSFGDHLDELRTCLIQGLIGVVLCCALCLVFGMEILKILCRPLLAVQHANGLQPSLQALSPTAGFVAYLKIGMLTGMILSMPWLLVQMWRFVASGLYARERRFLKWLVAPSVGLFAAGVLFMYSIVLPLVLQFFISFNASFGYSDPAPNGMASLLQAPAPEEQTPEKPAPQTPTDHESTPPPQSLRLLEHDPAKPIDGQVWVNVKTRRLMLKAPDRVWSVPLQPATHSPVMQSQFAIDFYVSFVLMLSLAFGIAFETPLVVFFLAWSGLVTAAEMRKARRYVLLATACLAAVLTPPDVISQLLLAGPMYLLFEIGLLATRWIDRSKQAPVEA